MPDLGPWKVCLYVLDSPRSEAFRKHFACAKDHAQSLLLAWALTPTQVIVRP